MYETIKKEWFAKVALIIFFIFGLWWCILRFLIANTNNPYNQLFSSLYGIMALWGAICGFFIARKYGFFKSILGRAIIIFSLGLFAQEFGQLAYSYYNYFLKIVVPYPSIGDIGYFGSIPLYIYGVVLLGQVSGIKVKLRALRHKLQAILIPLIMLTIGYFLFLQGYQFDWSNPLKVFLDFGYPVGEAIYISLGILTFSLSRNILGGKMHPVIMFILIALLMQFLSDYTFLYMSSKNIIYPGSINDFMYLVAYFLMTLGLIQFNHVLKKINSK